MSRLGLRARVIIAAVLGALVAEGLMYVVVVHPTARAAAARAYHLFDPVRPEDLARCAAEPERWSMAGPEYEVWAYDPATGRSANAGAPRLDRRLQWFTAFMEDPARFTLREEWGGLMLVDAAPTGPCGRLLVRWRPDDASRTLVRQLGVLAAFLAGLSSLGAATFVAVRPLTERLRAIGAAARAVGTGAYAPLEAGSDDLGAVGAILDAAHARVRSDGDQALQRHRALEQHMAEIAHDLRTPLAALQLRIEALRASAGEADRAELGACLDEVLYLALLGENLQSTTRLANPAPDDLVDLTALIERVDRRFRILAQRRGIELASAWPDDPLQVRAPAILLEQAVANLVHNAVVHNQAGGHVSVLLRAEADGGVSITVLDDGPGLPGEVLASLEQGEGAADLPRPRSSSGTRLGLQVVRGFCARAGWAFRARAGDPRGLALSLRSIA